MKINVTDRPIEKKEFAELPLGTPFIEDSWELNDSDVDMMLVKCTEVINPEDESKLNAIYVDDGTLTWVKPDKEVYLVDARIEVAL